MTKTEFISLVNESGGPECVLAIILETAWTQIYYLDNEHTLDLDNDITTKGGVDYLKHYTTVYDARPEMRPLKEHKITTYHPIDSIQAVQFVESAEEKRHLDRSEMFDF